MSCVRLTFASVPGDEVSRESCLSKAPAVCCSRGAPELVGQAAVRSMWCCCGLHFRGDRCQEHEPDGGVWGGLSASAVILRVLWHLDDQVAGIALHQSAGLAFSSTTPTPQGSIFISPCAPAALQVGAAPGDNLQGTKPVLSLQAQAKWLCQ